MKAVPVIKAFLMRVKDLMRPYLHPKQAQDALELTNQRAAFYNRFIKQNDLMFDVGANLGNRIEPLLALKCKIVAFEPQRLCCAYLRMKFGKRIILEPAALGSTVGTADLKLNRDSTTVASMSPEWQEKVGAGRFQSLRWKGSETVPVQTLAAAIKKHGVPAFIKIDVEGFEQEVLKGLTTICPMIAFEYTTPEMTSAAIGCIDLIGRLSAQYMFNFVQGERSVFELDQWLTANEMKTFIASETEKLQGFGDIYAKLTQ